MAVVPEASTSPWLEFTKPEVTTVIRWVLRVILVVFLAWLIRKRPEQEDEEDEGEGEDANGRFDSRRGGVKSRPASMRSVTRLQPQRDRYNQYSGDVRQRRNSSGRYGDGGDDVDAAIARVSKPKEMWEVKRSGEGPPLILPKRPQADGGAAGGAAGATPNSAASASLASLMASMASSTAPSVGGATPRGERQERPPKVAAVRPELQLKRAEAKVDPHEKMLHGHQRPVVFITWNREGNLLFTCGKDKLVCVWSIPDGECLGTYNGHSGAVWACSVTSDSRWLVTGGADQRVIVWEARESRELARRELPGVVRSVEWASGGSDSGTERFATCTNKFASQPAAVTVWSFDGTAIEEQFNITALPSPASQVRWGLKDELVVSAHESGEIVFWSAVDGTKQQSLQAHDKAISKFEFSQDRKLVATASHDQSIRIFDLGEGVLGEGSFGDRLYHVETDRPINDVALGPFTRETAIGAPDKRPTKCCVIGAGGQDVRSVTTTGSTTEQFNTLLFKLPKIDTFPGLLEADGVTKGHFGPVHTLAFAPDGTAIASGSEDGCVRLHFFDPPAPNGGGGKGAEQAPTPRPAP